MSTWNPSVLWHCWLGDRKGIRPVKICVLVCWWWRFDWSFACLIAPVITSTSIIHSSNKIQNGDILVLANPRSTWKMAFKTDRIDVKVKVRCYRCFTQRDTEIISSTLLLAGWLAFSDLMFAWQEEPVLLRQSPEVPLGEIWGSQQKWLQKSDPVKRSRVVL